MRFCVVLAEVLRSQIGGCGREALHAHQDDTDDKGRISMMLVVGGLFVVV